jgi:hypothetical protein
VGRATASALYRYSECCFEGFLGRGAFTMVDHELECRSSHRGAFACDRQRSSYLSGLTDFSGALFGLEALCPVSEKSKSRSGKFGFLISGLQRGA